MCSLSLLKVSCCSRSSGNWVVFYLCDRWRCYCAWEAGWLFKAGHSLRIANYNTFCLQCLFNYNTVCLQCLFNYNTKDQQTQQLRRWHPENDRDPDYILNLGFLYETSAKRLDEADLFSSLKIAEELETLNSS